MSKTNSELMKLIITKIDTLDSKLDKTNEKIHGIDITLVRNTESLEEHMRRTELLEKDIQPIKRHVHMLEGGLKLFGVLSLISSLIYGIYRLLTL